MSSTSNRVRKGPPVQKPKSSRGWTRGRASQRGAISSHIYPLDWPIVDETPAHDAPVPLEAKAEDVLESHKDTPQKIVDKGQSKLDFIKTKASWRAPAEYPDPKAPAVQHPRFGQHLTDPVSNNKSDFFCGQILIATMHTPNVSATATIKLEDLSPTKSGWVNTKNRPVIVLLRHASNMLVVPIRSRNGEGFKQYKNTNVYDEYIAVVQKNSGIPYDEGYHKDVLEEDATLREGSCVRLTDVVNIHYTEKVTPIGKLDGLSISLLMSLWHKRYTKCLHNEEQRAEERVQQEADEAKHRKILEAHRREDDNGGDGESMV